MAIESVVDILRECIRCRAPSRIEYEGALYHFRDWLSDKSFTSGPLLQHSVFMDDKIKRHLLDMRGRVELLRTYLEKFSERIKELETQDKLGDFEIQDLMSDANLAQTIASSIVHKANDTQAMCRWC